MSVENVLFTAPAVKRRAVDVWLFFAPTLDIARSSTRTPTAGTEVFHRNRSVSRVQRRFETKPSPLIVSGSAERSARVSLNT